MSNKKKWLLNEAFLTTLKEEIETVFSNHLDGEESNYLNCYVHISGTGGFYTALKNASEKHNVTKAIYLYACRLPWYDSDIFDDLVLLRMVELGVSEYGDETLYKDEFLKSYSKEGIDYVYVPKKHKGGYITFDKKWIPEIDPEAFIEELVKQAVLDGTSIGIDNPMHFGYIPPEKR